MDTDTAEVGTVRVYGPWQKDEAPPVKLRRIEGVEAIGTCFEYTLTLDSEDCSLSADALLGQRFQVQIDLGARGGRSLEGIGATVIRQDFPDRILN